MNLPSLLAFVFILGFFSGIIVKTLISHLSESDSESESEYSRQDQEEDFSIHGRKKTIRPRDEL